MQWLQYLALLACPLMMLFCMKGMFGGKGHHDHANNVHKHDPATSDEVKALQIKMTELMEQNQQLSKEIQSMKQMETIDGKHEDQQSSSRVVS